MEHMEIMWLGGLVCSTKIGFEIKWRDDIWKGRRVIWNKNVKF